MEDQKAYEDELAKRRQEREQARSAGRSDRDDDENDPKLGWKDIAALTIAAYQVLFPMLLAMVGALVAAWLLFRFVFR